MAEDSKIILAGNESSLGEVRIAPEVIEVIIGIAANKVDGVYSMRGSLANSFSELFRRQDRGSGKGVRLDQSEGELKVNVYAFLNYGVSVPKVALEIQEKVKQQVLFMTGLKLAAVDVHIQGVVPEKREPTVDPNNLFGEEDGEE
ncbi:Asp23/Gls24 family envelope stress response protein [Ligilactobacillus sp. WILCCON 0076]|uniref:Asp23/Gls24 family envelope stress response protein n=1 Tax=Ligilactobacillus ubinensis TaxID=2876789 RepID=A0A9X2FI91_9LACO|nr:Asp23/Gls24 family envelope stress response protein [Ligilactobacillus ubinensis]MCP0886427.1 Asp23/Gls24 family envelope stress response protein [Ligilactobacillus ubinensis]